MYIVGVGGWFLHFCLAVAAREHGAVEVDVAVAGGVPGEIFRVGLAITLSHNQNFGRCF